MQVINEVREVEFIMFRSGSLTYNGLQICDVAGLVALSYILQPMFFRSRMFLLPLNPP